MFNSIAFLLAALLSACQSIPQSPEPSPAPEPPAPAAPSSTAPQVRQVTVTRNTATSTGTPHVIMVNTAGSTPGNTMVLQALHNPDDEADEALARELDGLNEHMAQVLSDLSELDGLGDELTAYIQAAFAGTAGLSNPQVTALLDSMPIIATRFSQRVPEGVEFEENAAFLGVSSQPVQPQTSAQLSIPSGTGLVLTTVEPDSPAAAAGLKQLDVLAKLNDQMLVNPEQLAVLIRAHKPGDQVTLTYLRGGKEMVATATLGGRKLPRLAPGGGRADGGLFNPNEIMIELQGARPAGPRGVGRQPSPDATRQIADRLRAHVARAREEAAAGAARSRDPMQVIARPRFQPQQDGDTHRGVLDDAELTYTTDDIAVTYRSTSEGTRQMTVKDLQNDTTIFDEDREPTPQELEQMRPEVREDLTRMLSVLRSGKWRTTPPVPPAPSARPVPPVPPVPPAPSAPPAAPAKAPSRAVPQTPSAPPASMVAWTSWSVVPSRASC